MKNGYKEEIQKTLKTLIGVRHLLFQRAVNLAMNGTMEDFSEAFETGEEFHFELAHVDKTSDVNLQKLVDLIKQIETTAESIANLNGLDLKEYMK